ncbi:DUF6297 family protein [Actinocorallia herbida]|uniref:DUF6297 family protein n=1 Tax=Actinocorallia herbida TaxID=58109 RepID=UPI0011CD9875|nr:DUF6297 family protein [Actinocorallia herbida]
MDETRAVLALVRGGRRRARRGGVAYQVYVGVLVAAVAGPTAWASVRDALESTADPGRAVALAPFAVAVTALAVLWGSVREGVLRGPVSVDAAVIDWVLPSPVRWETVLGSAFARGVAVRAAAGAALCLIVLFVLWRTVLPLPPVPGAALATSALAGALLGTLSAALRASGPTWIRRSWYAALLLLLASAAALAWKGVPGASGALWSGPWGWAAQGVVGEPSAWAGLAALAVVTVCALVFAARRLSSRTFGELRRGAELTGGLKAGLWLVDPGWAAGTGETARADFSASVRVPLPTLPVLAPAWRDLVTLLRDVDRLLRSAVLTVLALLAAQSPGPAGVAASCGLLYLAVSALTEGARSCAGDPGRTRYLPLRPETLALAFGLTPLAVAGTLTAVGAAALAGLGADPAGLARVALLLPAAVATALAGAYRGFLPQAALTGIDTPFGNSVPFQVAFWHGAGPVTLTVIALVALPGGPAGAAWLAAGTALAALWAARRGARALTA